MRYSRALQKKIKNYYTVYYRDLCGLPDWEVRVEKRIHEEDKEVKRIERVQSLLNKKFTATQKHFIFGAGTGGLAITLSREYGCDVYGIEPDEEEFEIIQDKCTVAGINSDNFKKEYGEELSFGNDQFDVVNCFTVIEHVEDEEKCIQEMIRITKPGGHIYINTPNYNYPYEGHYKIPFPTFLPKPLGYFYLILIGRPWKFLKTINFVTEKSINKILNRQKNIEWMRVYRPLERKTNIMSFFFNFIKHTLFIYPDQEIIIKKIS
ncbi:hypothetical protein COB64_00490 [Candidatus Wolfebacteria bacterium]|nr:MAG: hypothetical protein COB64_00490 [Candidatus Wolfebacteria bacterium]